MGVPNTTTFTLQNVVDAVNPTTDDLVDCFNDAIIGKFDSNYGPGDESNLLQFRNYDAGGSWALSDITENSNSPATLSSSILGGTDSVMVPIFVDQGGTRLYIKDHFEGKIIQASIATANDISSTIAYVAKSPAYFSLAADSLTFSSNGTKLFYGPAGGIREHSLSTAWDITTVSNTINSSLSVPASSAYGDDIIMIGGTGNTYAFKGGVAVADYNSSGTPPGGEFSSSLNKNYIYYLERTGTTPNYVWKLKQYNTNL